MNKIIIATVFAASIAGAQTISNTIATLQPMSRELGSSKAGTNERGTVVQPGDGILPVLMNGTGLRSLIHVVNLEDRMVDYQVFLLSEDGRMASLPMAAGSAAMQGTILANSSVEITTSGTGSTTTCWAMILSSAGRIAPQLSVQEMDASRVWRSSTVLGSNSSLKKVRLAFDNTQDYATTAVLTNANTEGSQALTVTIRNTRGEALVSDTYSMTALHQYALRLADDFPVTAGLRGTIELSIPSTSRFGIGLMGVRLHSTGAFDLIDSLALVNWANLL